jgi:hypothetical protein
LVSTECVLVARPDSALAAELFLDTGSVSQPAASDDFGLTGTPPLHPLIAISALRLGRLGRMEKVTHLAIGRWYEERGRVAPH